MSTFIRPLSSVRARTNVILVGKCDSHRLSSTSFSENVLVAITSYQMLGILSFSDRERSPSTEIRVLTFVVKKVQGSFSGCLFLESRQENLMIHLNYEFYLQTAFSFVFSSMKSRPTKKYETLDIT